MGYALNTALRRARDHEKTLAFTIGAVTLVVGAAQALEFDLILAAMALGATTRNLAPRRSTNAFEMVRRFSPPIYVLFFVFVGARLDVRGIPPWMWAVAAAYLVGRTAGKMAGANLGARIGRAGESVKKYLGLTLFSQAGVAVGLAIMASVRFPGETGDAIVTIITATTFVVQLIGPPCVKYAIHKAGEAGRDITEEDLMESLKVSEIMQGKAFTFMADTPLPQILLSIAETEAIAYPVVVQDNELIGMISIQGLKQSFAIEGEKHWYLAYDLMEPVPDVVTGDMPIGEAVTKMRELYLDYMPVVESDENRKLIGMLELREVSRQIANELIMRRGDV
jgi:CBS domain-containing protein